MTWKVLCDFDGTISRTDTIDDLLERFAAPGWKEIEREWTEGRIGSAECMRRQVELLRVSLVMLDAWLDSIEIDPYFAAFVTYCHQNQIAVHIVSDGIDHVIRSVLAQHGLEGLPITANHLFSRGGDRFGLTSPASDVACTNGAGTCKCAVVQAKSALSARILYIGDGRSDFCVADKATLVLAKSALLTHCEQRRLSHMPYRHFGDAMNILHALLTKTPQYHLTA